VCLCKFAHLPEEKNLNSFWLSLCESFAPLQLASVTEEERIKIIRTVTEFTAGQLSCLPIFLRLCLNLGLFFFQTFVLITTLRPFQSHNLESRKKMTEAWAYGHFGLARQLFRPVRSLAIFAFYEEPVLIKQLERSKRCGATS